MKQAARMDQTGDRWSAVVHSSCYTWVSRVQMITGLLDMSSSCLESIYEEKYSEHDICI